MPTVLQIRILASKQHLRLDEHFTITIFKLKPTTRTESSPTSTPVPSINDVIVGALPKRDFVNQESPDDDANYTIDHNDGNVGPHEETTDIANSDAGVAADASASGIASASMNIVPSHHQDTHGPSIDAEGTGDYECATSNMASPTAQGASTYVKLHAQQRPQVRTLAQPANDAGDSSGDESTIDWESDEIDVIGRSTVGPPLMRNSARRLIESCYSSFETDRPIYSSRVNKLYGLNQADLSTLSEQLEEHYAEDVRKCRRVKVKRADPPAVREYQGLRHTVKYLHKDCIIRCGIVGATHDVVFGRSAELANELRFVVNTARTNSTDEDSRAPVVARIKEFVAILKPSTLSMSTKIPVSEILDMQPLEANYRTFVENIDNELRRLATLVFDAILRSPAFERQVELTLWRQKPKGRHAGEDRYQLGQLQALAKRLYDQRSAAVRDFEKGKVCDWVNGVWRFAFPGMLAANFRVSLIEFDGQQKTTHWSPIVALDDVHVKLLLSYDHVWVLTGTLDAMLKKSPGYMSQCDTCGLPKPKCSSVSHTCPYGCPRCLHNTCDGNEWRSSDAAKAAGKTLHYCERCRRTFIDGPCFDSHVAEQFVPGKPASLCALLQLCEMCGARVDLSNKHAAKHDCRTRRCPTCSEKIDVDAEEEHLCWMTTINPSLLRNKKLRSATPMVYDIETVRDADGTMHPVTLIVGQCAPDDESDPEIVREFEGYDCVEQFVRFVMEDTEHCCFVAHNGSRFDVRFVVNELYRQGINCNPLDVPGAGILQVVVKANSVRFVDSCCMSPSSLINYFKSYAPPEAVAKQASKDFFPYKLLTTANYERRYLPQPSLDDYEPNMQRTQKEVNALSHFYDTTVEPLRASDTTFDLKRTLREYCIRDVKMLAMAFRGFRKVCITAGADPVCDCITVASMAFRIWRTHFLQPNSVAVCKELVGMPTSKKASLYFEYLRRGNHPDVVSTIQHKGTAGKERIVQGHFRPYSLDGFDPATGTAYEFLGCYFHGCPVCFPHNRDVKNANLRKTFAELYESVEFRKRVILEKNKHVKRYVQVWEHEWDAQLRDPANVHMQEFVNAELCISPSPLVERDCLFGGTSSLNP